MAELTRKRRQYVIHLAATLTWVMVPREPQADHFFSALQRIVNIVRSPSKEYGS